MNIKSIYYALRLHVLHDHSHQASRLLDLCSGSSLPLIFCIYVRYGPIYWERGVFTM